MTYLQRTSSIVELFPGPGHQFLPLNLVFLDFQTCEISTMRLVFTVFLNSNPNTKSTGVFCGRRRALANGIKEHVSFLSRKLLDFGIIWAYQVVMVLHWFNNR